MLRSESAVYYECGYSCDNAIFLRLGKEAFFITDGRYTVDAEANVKDAAVITTNDLAAAAKKLLKKHNVKKIAYDPKEWTLFAFERLSSELKCTFKPIVDMSHKKRILKTPKEMALLDEAARLGAQAFDAFALWLDKKGSDKNETRLTWKAASFLSDKGRFPLSFEPIVAIGENAAKPHATPTNRRLRGNDLLLMDAGLKYRRYCSDRTRTVNYAKGFAFDYTQRFDDKTMQKAYDTVLKAHDRAIAKAKTGMKARKIDALAREVIEKAGFGKYFIHSTGHGVGLDIHEMPYISSRSETRIEEGMVFTIEPGIYIPGYFGIRIEDTVAMVNGRAKILGL